MSLSLLASSALICLPSSAQDGVRSEPPEAAPQVDPVVDSPAPSDEKPLELTIEQAVAIAATNNLDLRVSALETEIAHFDELGSWGTFDWVFDSSISYSEGERPFEDSDLRPIDTDGDGDIDQFDDVTQFPQVYFINSADLETWSFNNTLQRPFQTGGRFTARLNKDLTDRVVNGSHSDNSQDLLSLSYVQPLMRGAWSNYATASQTERNIQYRQQIELERTQRQTILNSVYTGYWDLVSTLEQHNIAVGALGLGQKQEQRNQRKLDAGMGTEVEVLQAQAQVATREEALIRAETDVEQAMDALKKILFPGRNEEVVSCWERRIVPMTELPKEASSAGLTTWQDAYEVALNERPELVRQRLEIDAARVRHERSQSDKRPLFDLSVTAESNGVNEKSSHSFQDTLAGEFLTTRAMLTYNVNLGNRFANNTERAQRGRLRTAFIRLENLETDIKTEVRGAVRDVRYQSAAVKASQKSLELATRQLEVEEARYNLGDSTLFQVLEFQQSLIEAETSERSARVNFAKAQVALRKAQGLIGR